MGKPARADRLRRDLVAGDHRLRPASSLGGLIGARAVLGLGEAAPFPAMTRVIADWTPPTRRSFMQGLTHSFVSIGTTATPPLVAWLMGYCRLARRFPAARRPQRRLGDHLGMAFPR